MVFAIGETFRVPVMVINPASGAAVIGGVVTYTLYDEANVVHVAAGACTEIGNGDYETANITPDAAGIWKVTFNCAVVGFSYSVAFVVGMGLEQDIEDFVDTEIASLMVDVGDASTATLGSIYGILGNPATTIVAQLTAIDDYIDTEVAAIQTSLNGGTDATNRAVGRCQIIPKTVDLHNGAGALDIATATTQAVLLESLVFSTIDNIADDATGITGISIQTDNSTPQVIIPATMGVIANLTALAQLAWTGAIYLAVGDKVQLTIIGGTADANPTTCNVILKCRAIVNGGYLA